MKFQGFRFRSTSTLAGLLAGLLLTLAFAPAALAAEDPKWQLRLFASLTDPSNADDIDSDTRVTTDTDLGFGISLEYRFAPRVGLELGTLLGQPDVEVTQLEDDGGSIMASDSLRLTPIYAALNFHLTPNRKIDTYIGPILAYVLYDNLTLAPGNGIVAELDADDDFAFGAHLGFDAPLGDGPWTFGASVKYLDTTFESVLVGGDADDTADLDIDPIILTLGFGYRF